MFSGSTDIGIDLGTANILVYVKGKGTVLNEPSVVAVEKKTNKILAVGSEAREMLGRTPHGIVAVRPLREGVIANYTITQKMLEYLIHKVAGKSFFFRPRVMTCIPVNITSVEKRAVLEATIQAGVSKTYLIEEPLAAALGEESVTLEDLCEPYLMQMGFLTRTPRGRCATRLAYEHLGLKAPEAAAPEDNGQQSLF